MDSPKDIWHFACPTRGEILVRVERGEYHVQDDVFLEWLKRPT